MRNRSRIRTDRRARRVDVVARLFAASLVASLLGCGGGDGGGGIVQPRSQPALSGITVSPTALALQVTQTGQLQATLAGPGAATGRGTITFASSAAAVATVAANGLVTAVGPGTATITVSGTHPASGDLTASSVSTSAVVTVTARPIAAVTLSLTAMAIEVGQQAQATAVARDGTGTAVPEAPIAFASAKPGVATISQAGLITAIEPGTTLISASSGTVVQTALLTVTPAFIPVASIQPFTIANTTGGSTRALTVVPLDAAGVPLTGRECTWVSTAPTIASVTSPGMTTTLAVVAALPRTTAVTITVTCEGRSASATFNATPIPVASVQVTRDSAYLAHGETGAIRVTFRDAQHNVLSGREAVFFDANGFLGLPPGGEWTPCATEGQTCTFTGQRLVRYGADGQYAYRTTSASIRCDNGAFEQDPVPNTAKACAHAAPASSATGRVDVTAWHCFANNCPRGARNADVHVVPVENPQGVTGRIAQAVVPAFVLTRRTPVDTGPLSIETAQSLTFSNTVAAAGLGDVHFGLRDVGSTELLLPSVAYGVNDSVITYQSAPLTENRRYEFYYTDALRDVYGKPLRNPGSFQYRTVLMDKLYYYRLSSDFSASQGRSFAISSSTLQCQTERTNPDDPRQRWYVAPLNDAHPGLDLRLSADGARVRLRNQFFGDTRNLEGATPLGPCQMNPASTAQFGGELWFGAERFGASTWLHVGDATFALDQPGAGTIVGLAETGPFSGQRWNFTRVGRR